MERFKYWVILVVGSVLLIGSWNTFTADTSDGDGTDWVYYNERNTQLAQSPIFVSSSLISTVLSSCGVVVCILQKNKYTFAVETVLILSMTALWCFTTGTLIFVSFYNEEKTSLNFPMTFPQLYFISWGLAITSIMNFASWFKQQMRRDDQPLTTQWVLLVAMGAFVALSGIAFANQNVEDVDVVTGVVTATPVCRTATYSCRVSFFVFDYYHQSPHACLACVFFATFGPSTSLIDFFPVLRSNVSIRLTFVIVEFEFCYHFRNYYDGNCWSNSAVSELSIEMSS